MQHLHAIKNFLDHGIRNTDFLKLAVWRQLASRNLLYVNHSGQMPIYKYIYPESELVC